MAENIQWIKIKVGMFDGDSFKKIKRAKIGGVDFRDKLTAIWFELLDLAGKGNNNGFLIDGNEMPFESYEQIAIMIDRQTQELELCMKFFINEKMVEVVEDMYCLTNFVKYQSIDKLDKIREQKRIAQAKWREKKAFLIENSEIVDEQTSTEPSTETTTTHLPSNSNSISNKKITKNKVFIEFSNDNKELLEAFYSFEEMRNKKKKPLTERSSKMICNELEELAHNDTKKQIEIVDQSINMCWLGMFPIKKKAVGENQRETSNQFLRILAEGDVK